MGGWILAMKEICENLFKPFHNPFPNQKKQIRKQSNKFLVTDVQKLPPLKGWIFNLPHYPGNQLNT